MLELNLPVKPRRQILRHEDIIDSHFTGLPVTRLADEFAATGLQEHGCNQAAVLIKQRIVGLEKV